MANSFSEKMGGLDETIMLGNHIKVKMIMLGNSIGTVNANIEPMNG